MVWKTTESYCCRCSELLGFDNNAKTQIQDRSSRNRTESDFMTNPYTPSILIDCELQSHVQGNNSIEKLFWVKHFLTFQLSFAFIWISLLCVNDGIAAFVEMAITTPRELLVLPTIGTCVWVLHAVLALACPRMRRVRARTTAIGGSSFWLVGMLIYECLTKILPQKLSISLRWTPDTVLLTLYSALSLVAVWLVVRMHSDHTNKSAGNNAMGPV